MSIRDHVGGRRPPNDTKSGQSITKVIWLAVTLAVLLSVGVSLFVKGRANAIRTDPITLCAVDGPPTEIVVLLLDMSDEFSTPQRLKIRNEIERIRATVKRFGLVEVYAVDRMEQRVTTPLVHLCNPGTGADMNRLYQNPALAKRKWGEFANQLDIELDRLMSMPSTPTSAIFEAIQATSLRTFNRAGYDTIPKRLVVISDLMQNVPGRMSQYRETEPFDSFQNSSYYSNIRADLSGVAVTVLYLVRPNAPQRWPDHLRFWEQYFLAQGAIVTRLEPVYGAQ